MPSSSLAQLRQRYELMATTETSPGPSRYYRVADQRSRIGFISPHSHNFCEHCNRVRLTPTGRLLLCLGQEHSIDLRQMLRDPGCDDASLRAALIDSMAIKPKGHDFDLGAQPAVLRYMNFTGG